MGDDLGWKISNEPLYFKEGIAWSRIIKNHRDISSSSNGQAAKLCPLAAAYGSWLAETQQRFNQLKANEEELNRIFIDIYGLQDELTPEVEEKDVTVRQADLQRDIKSLISYCVGIMFGRYSLDVDGLAYAGGDWDSSKYKTFIPDDDNIIPICDKRFNNSFFLLF